MGIFIKHEVPVKDKEIKTEASIPDHKVGIKLVLDALTKGEGAVIADMKRSLLLVTGLFMVERNSITVFSSTIE